jgi:hypothetical protein
MTDKRSPTLAALVEQPELFAALSPEAQDQLYGQVAMLEAMLRAKLLARVSNGRDEAPEPDRAVLLGEAGTILGMSKDFLYRHWRKLGGYRDDDGHVKFTMRTIERHLRQG